MGDDSMKEFAHYSANDRVGQESTNSMSSKVTKGEAFLDASWTVPCDELLVSSSPAHLSQRCTDGMEDYRTTWGVEQIADQFVKSARVTDRGVLRQNGTRRPVDLDTVDLEACRETYESDEPPGMAVTLRPALMTNDMREFSCRTTSSGEPITDRFVRSVSVTNPSVFLRSGAGQVIDLDAVDVEPCWETDASDEPPGIPITLMPVLTTERMSIPADALRTAGQEIEMDPWLGECDVDAPPVGVIYWV